MDEIYKRWGTELSDNQEWSMLKNRLKLAVGTPALEATSSTVNKIAFSLGEERHQVGDSNRYTGKWFIRTEKLIDRANTPLDLARVIESLIENVDSVSEKSYFIAQMINDTNCGMHFKKTKDKRWISYPQGEKVLDEALVDVPLSFLAGKAAKEYQRALDHYINKKWEECAEKTRRAVEEYLRSQLCNTRGLEANIKELGAELEKQGKIPSHLRNTLMGILRILDTHYNASSKHNSNTHNEPEAEFLIYQTGLLMRLIEKLGISVKGAKRG